jgi:hypothetical protein
MIVCAVVRFAGSISNLPLNLLRPGPLLWNYVRTQGNGPASLLNNMADSAQLPVFGEAGHGIRRQSIEVHRLRRRVRFHGRRTTLLPRQAIHQRPQALQAVQGKTRPRGLPGSLGDSDHLFAVRGGDHGSVQANPGQACAVPVMLSKAVGGAGAASYARAELKSAHGISLRARYPISWR